MGDPWYCWEVFSRASYALSVGKGEVKERLVAAAMQISILSSQLLPDQVRDEYDELMKMLSAKGTIRGTVSTMRKGKAAALADKIITIEVTLREICYADS
jgi:hypothetical protein